MTNCERESEQALLSRADLAIAIGEYSMAETRLHQAVARQYPEFDPCARLLLGSRHRKISIRCGFHIAAQRQQGRNRRGARRSRSCRTAHASAASRYLRRNRGGRARGAHRARERRRGGAPVESGAATRAADGSRRAPGSGGFVGTARCAKSSRCARNSKSSRCVRSCKCPATISRTCCIRLCRVRNSRWRHPLPEYREADHEVMEQKRTGTRLLRAACLGNGRRRR